MNCYYSLGLGLMWACVVDNRCLQRGFFRQQELFSRHSRPSTRHHDMCLVHVWQAVLVVDRSVAVDRGDDCAGGLSIRLEDHLSTRMMTMMTMMMRTTRMMTMMTMPVVLSFQNRVSKMMEYFALLAAVVAVVVVVEHEAERLHQTCDDSCWIVEQQLQQRQPQLPEMDSMRSAADDYTPSGLVLDLLCTSRNHRPVVCLRVYCHRLLFAIHVVNSTWACRTHTDTSISCIACAMWTQRLLSNLASLGLLLFHARVSCLWLLQGRLWTQQVGIVRTSRARVWPWSVCDWLVCLVFAWMQTNHREIPCVSGHLTVHRATIRNWKQTSWGLVLYHRFRVNQEFTVVMWLTSVQVRFLNQLFSPNPRSGLGLVVEKKISVYFFHSIKLFIYKNEIQSIYISRVKCETYK